MSNTNKSKGVVILALMAAALCIGMRVVAQTPATQAAAQTTPAETQRTALP